MENPLCGKKSLLFDDEGDNKNRIIICPTIKNLAILANSVSCIMDGKFLP
jgi:hypothetical protein